ncbi:MAG: serine/threonine-protein kinase, partial [Myxococcota bacterium]
MPSAMYCGRCLSTFEGNETSCPNLSCGVHRPTDGWGLVLAAGDVLDRHYRIEKCLAVGGAGLTYLARELDDRGGEPIGPKLAIKVLYSARASGSFLRRLSTEAQILQELDHDNIVELRGFVHRAGIEPYLVTRFEEGGSLAAHVDRVGPLSGPVAAGILRQVLRALEMAHQVGVIHRDLKPDNVLLAAQTGRDEAPVVRIADFGIAKVSGAVGERVTRTGAFVGTPEFAAPEQFDGKTPTPATDVFAAGALLVFLLTGRPPFQLDRRADIEASRDQVLAQMPIRLPAIAGADSAMQAAMQQVVDVMTRIDPRERASVEQVLAALDPLVRDTFDFERPPL